MDISESIDFKGSTDDVTDHAEGMQIAEMTISQESSITTQFANFDFYSLTDIENSKKKTN